MRELVVIGCGLSKLERRAPARELYTGSLFRSCRRFAEATGAPWGILSALHGFVRPEQELDPYDARLPSGQQWLALQERVRWGRAAADALLRAHSNVLGGAVICLAGADYADALRVGLEPFRVRMLEPLRGLGLGQRRGWLRQATELASSKDGREVTVCL